ncbi:MAG: hypothetical protein GC202_03255 [Alphaproteobacteria bacterium]|nr:hypothetical protein [Alphaproteobacteria bacterium]
MPPFDPRSIVLVLLVVITGLTVQLYLTMRRQHDSRGLSWWTAAATCGIASIMLLLARDSIPDILSIWLAHVLIQAVHLLLWTGVRAFDGKALPVRIVAALLGGFAIVFGMIVAAGAGLETRTTFVSLCSAAFCVPVVRALMSDRSLPSRGYAALLLSAMIGVFVSRAAAAQYLSPGDDFLAPTGFQLVLLVLQVLLAPLWMVALLAMVGERAQKRLAEALAEQRRASEAKSEFLRRLAHEVRTPLGAVSGLAELIRERAADEKARDQARHIGIAADHMIALSDELLDLARIEAGRLDVDARPVSVETAIHEALAMLRAPFERRRMRVALSTPARVTLLADPRHLRQMLLNVLGNAAKFGREDGHVEIRVDLGTGGVAISVADDGEGIDVPDPNALLEPFARGIKTGGIEGTGLGLPIVKGFVEAHGGRVTIESAAGKGTKVTLFFPPERVQRQA